MATPSGACSRVLASMIRTRSPSSASDPAARPLYQLRPGKPLTVEIDGDGALRQLRFVTGNGTLLSIARAGERFAAVSAPAATEVRWSMAAGEIRSSLFGAADAAGLPDTVTLQLADVFAGDIDFYKDIQRGDRFAVVYETRYLDGEAIGAGRIVAAEFANRGKTFQAFLWRDADGSESYFEADGAALRGAFLRSPMEFSRVTSGFSNARFHPILQTWRAHRASTMRRRRAPRCVRLATAACSSRALRAGTASDPGAACRARSRRSTRTCRASLPQVKRGARVHAGRGDRLRRADRVGTGSAPALRVPRRTTMQRNPLTVALPTGEPLAGRDARAHSPRASSPPSRSSRSHASSPARCSRAPSSGPRRAGAARSPRCGRELYAGVMSGTSLDGVDAVIAEFAPASGRACELLGAAHATVFAAVCATSCWRLQRPGPDELARAARAANALADAYAEAIAAALHCRGRGRRGSRRRRRPRADVTPSPRRGLDAPAQQCGARRRAHGHRRGRGLSQPRCRRGRARGAARAGVSRGAVRCRACIASSSTSAASPT